MKSINYRNSFLILLTGLSICLGFSSCNNDDNSIDAEVMWIIGLNSKFENPGVPNRSETGYLQLILYSDNTLQYAFQVNGLKTGDVLTMAHLYAGDPLTNGPVVLALNPTFGENEGYGSVQLRKSLADSLLNKEVELYFNIHSQEVPSGLVRGQVNSDIILASDVYLSGANEVPPVSTNATGLAALRLATNKKLYSKVTVANLESGDSWSMAHIHSGATGVNGSILVTLCGSSNDFGVEKITTLDDQTINKLVSDSTYANAHSTLHPSGTIRGQVQNESKFQYVH